ncbi:MAG: DUF1849 family protein [Alphaproteobacteria bacterium]|nr:DUF1849 family protein [Alphaproteobacteria bacterium]MBL6953604.1 DUF1849 family protein [Alphaproteobacteria bacterium]
MLKGTSYFRAIIFLFLILLPVETAAQMLRPARSVYELKLDQSRKNPGIDAAKGRLVVELLESCDGFIFNQGFISKITSDVGPDIFGDMQASVWESRDGRTVRFNLLNRINGKISDQEQGRAGLDSQGAGSAAWQLPKTRELALPKGTIFPISHNRIVLEHALRGSRGFEVALFDGSYDAGYYLASAVIGNRTDQGRTDRKQGEGKNLLAKDLSSWPVRLAYYHHDSRLGVPDFEVGFTLYSDGVVDDLVLDYPEFGLTGRLVQLQYFDRPACD